MTATYIKYNLKAITDLSLIRISYVYTFGRHRFIYKNDTSTIKGYI